MPQRKAATNQPKHPALETAQALTGVRWRIHCALHRMEDLSRTTAAMEAQIATLREEEQTLVRRLSILDPERLAEMQRHWHTRKR